jgi:hypothetical protein
MNSFIFSEVIRYRKKSGLSKGYGARTKYKGFTYRVISFQKDFGERVRVPKARIRVPRSTAN